MRLLFSAGVLAATMAFPFAPAPVWSQSFNLSGDIGLLATLQVAGEGWEVDLYQDWAFVAAGAEGLKAVDLRHPRYPVVEGTLSNVGTAVYVVARSLDEIYVLAWDVPRAGEDLYSQGIFVLRWDASSLRFEERGFVPVDSPGQQGKALDLQYPTLYLAAYPRLYPVDVSVPTRPVVGPFWDLPFSAASDIVRSDRWAFMFYVAASDKGLGIYETLHAPPRVLDGQWLLVDTPGDANHIALRETLCYLSDGAGGLRLIDVSNPNSPVERGALEPSGYGAARSLDLAFPLVYLANGYGGLLVVDVSSSTAPAPVAAIEPEQASPGFDVRAVAFEPGEDLVAALTQQGLLLIAQYPERIPTPTPDADLNNDGRVDSLDAFLFGRQWQTQGPTPTPSAES